MKFPSFSRPLARLSPLVLSAGALIMFGLTAGAYAKDSVPDWVKAATQEQGKYPATAQAVVLLDETVFTVGNDGKAVERRRRVVKILRPTGRDQGYVLVPFDNDSKILSLHIWSIGPDGTEYAVKDRDVVEVGEPNAGSLYSDLRAKICAPPGRDPGGVIAYEYEQRQKPYQHEVDWFFQEDIPRLKQSFLLELPANYTYASNWAHHAPEKAIDLEHQKYRWDLVATPGIDLDRVPMAPSIQALTGRMAIHYGAPGQTPALGTWKEVGFSYDLISHDRIVATPDIAAKAAELTAGKNDFYDKVEAIAEFVQKDIRYFVIEKGIGGLQPHPAVDIFRNRYGDCKDKATLLSAMLGSVGVHSTLVLVDTQRGFVDPESPSMLGNHAIAAVEIPASYNSSKLRSVVTAKTGRRYLIVDPTWDKTAFGQLEANLQGGYGVLVEGKDSEIVRFPVLAPELNTISRTGAMTLDEDGTLKGSIIEKRFGDTSEHLRSLYARGDAKAQQAYFDKRLGHDFSSFNVSNLKVEDLNALNKPVTSSFMLTADRYSRAAGPLLMVRPRILGSDGMAIDRKPRVYPIDLEETMLHNDDFTIAIPAGYTVDELPAPVKLDLGFASYESSTALDGNSLHYKRTYIVRELSLPADRYADVQKLAETIETDEQNHAVFKKK